jgi:hypothetical protein
MLMPVGLLRPSMDATILLANKNIFYDNIVNVKHYAEI